MEAYCREVLSKCNPEDEHTLRGHLSIICGAYEFYLDNPGKFVPMIRRNAEAVEKLTGVQFRRELHER